MTHVLVDAVLFVPPATPTKRELEQWLKMLNNWMQEAANSPYQWMCAWDAIYQLRDDNRFLTHKQLQEWTRSFDLNIDPKQIKREIDTFIKDESKMLKAEKLMSQLASKHYSIKLEGEDYILLDPDEVATRWDGSIQDKMFLFLALLCANKKFIELQDDEAFFMATEELTKSARSSLDVVTFISYMHEAASEQHEEIEQSFLLVFTPDELPEHRLKKWDQTEEALRDAISQECAVRFKGETTKPFTFGKHFMQSLKTRAASTHEDIFSQIVRVAAYILVGQAYIGLRDHPFKVGEAGTTQQIKRKRDQAKGRRHNITSSKGGYRLNYWQIPGGTIEFANVENKNDHPPKIETE